MAEGWGAFVARRARMVLAVGLLATLLAGGVALGVFGALAQGGFGDAGSESARAAAAERALFGNRGADVVVIVSDDELHADDPVFRGAVQRMLDGLPDDAVTAVVPYWADPALVSADGHHAQVLISLAGVDDAAQQAAYGRLADDLTAPGLATAVTGPFAVFADVTERARADLERAELVTVPLLIVLALVVFRSAVAALMPLLVAGVSMAGALAVLRALAEVTQVSVFAANLISLLGIGLAVDYALFVVSRFREERARTDDVAVAITVTLATAGRTVLFSGLTVAAALASLVVFPQSFLRSMGYGGVAAVLVAVAAALTVLPAALVLLGPRIDAGRLPGRLGRPIDHDADGRRWEALAVRVMRRPVLVVVGTTLALLVIAAPFLGVRWGALDYRVLPAEEPSHAAAALLAREFGPETSVASIVVQGEDISTELPAYLERLRAVPGVAQVDTVVARSGEGGSAALVRVAWAGNAQTEASQDVVRGLRAVDLPSGTALVGGVSATTVDLIASVGAHLPVMGAIVLVEMLVLLFWAFGSVVLPLKAVAMNLISITASFGVVTWVFSDGNGADLLGFTPVDFLDATNPILMLAILFGLSMDYEVFLLSRVREEWDRTGDNRAAVAAGVRRTGRIITSAALLLAVVIGAFSTGGIVFMKMLGVGMLVALVIDATVVRALLVPATMALLGRWNWWAPAPMAQWWARHGMREGGPVPDPAFDPASGLTTDVVETTSVDPFPSTVTGR